MEQKLTIGKSNAQEALAGFCEGKNKVVLVTDGAAYGLCGAEKFFDEFFAAHPSVAITHLVVPNANPKVETVQELLNEIKGSVDGFIAVGGGTTIDTAKLLNLAVVSGMPIKELLTQKTAPEKLLPCMAFPTTAGTGAEATRFAVCYYGEVKYSIDFEVIRPSDVALVPEFTYSLPQYQTAATGFDAYAQAIESYWAKGATPESKEYSVRALAYLNILPVLFDSGGAVACEKREAMMLGAYWAGRAIDISRTTAAHAYSYILTSRYGIPHGHAVAMIFPYVFKWTRGFLGGLFARYEPLLTAFDNWQKIEEALALESMARFFNEKYKVNGIKVIKMLADSVNKKRLSNHPIELPREMFLEMASDIGIAK